MVLKWNARVLRTVSCQNGPVRGSELRSSPALVSQSTGILRVVADKSVCACLGPFHLNWPEPVPLGQPDWTNGKWPKRKSKVDLTYIPLIFVMNISNVSAYNSIYGVLTVISQLCTKISSENL